ncbi:DUF4401 domain-containing protein [Cupriavidus pauculus]|uniref:DUF4401 domain-containing protein n=1 Tax=Cupriavidus pauculus TaxID=82633 RepID=UPI001FD02468|nr:DUF4401 domain-containing protein [Cupriavidus pauculus]
MNRDRIERTLWSQLSARGAVSGDYVATQRVPWPIRLLMGGAGWLGALFFQLFLVGTVFVSMRENGVAMAVTGIVMIGIAMLLFRVKAKESGRIAMGQFALAMCLGGQGMLVVGVGEVIGANRLVDTAPFWMGVALLEAVLFLLVPDRLHRFIAALGMWSALAMAVCIGLGDLVAPRWTAIPVALGVLVAVALAMVLTFALQEAAAAASGRHAMWEPAADATLLFAVAGALIVTAFAHPVDLLFGTATARPAPGFWLAGALIGAELAALVLIECKRLACDPRVSASVLAVALAFGALMVYAPAVSAGVLAMAVALRRGSLPWLGLAIGTVLIGFVWYYGTLHWTLLAKSATLAGAGVLLLMARALAIAVSRKESVA